MANNESDDTSSGCLYELLRFLFALIFELALLIFLTQLIFWGFGIPNWSPRFAVGLLGTIVLVSNIIEFI